MTYSTLKTLSACIAAWLFSGFAGVAATAPEVSLVPVSVSQPRAVTSLDIDPAGETLMATGVDGAVRIWSLTTGEAKAAYLLHTGDATAALFTRDGRILSVGNDGRAVLTDARTGQVERTWTFPTWCLGLAIIDDDTAAIGCADLKIRIVKLSDGRIEREVQAPGDIQYQYVISLSASPDGRMLATSNPATIVDIQTGQAVATAPSFLRRLVFSPDGQTLLGGNMKAGAELWAAAPLGLRFGLATEVERPIQTPAGPLTAPQPMPIYGVAWSPDGRLFATGGLDRIVRIWRMRAEGGPVEIARLEGHESAISSLAWRKDSLVSGDLGGIIRLWPRSTWTAGASGRPPRSEAISSARN